MYVGRSVCASKYAGKYGGKDDPRVCDASKMLEEAELAGDDGAIRAAQAGLVAARALQAATHDRKADAGRPAAAAAGRVLCVCAP